MKISNNNRNCGENIFNIHFNYPRKIILKRRKAKRMDNNKNRIKDRKKSNAELRKMNPKVNADVGIINGEKIGVHDGKHEKSK